MQFVLELFPLLAFFVAFKLGDLYTATAVLMGAMALLLVVDYVRERKIPPMHSASAVLVFVLGTATLLLQDDRFIKWKPTAFFWIVALVFLGSFWIGKSTITERMLGAAFGPDSGISPTAWRWLNALWVVFFVVLGVVNLAVAFNASNDTWVNFKVAGIPIATIAFMGAQVLWLARRARVTA